MTPNLPSDPVRAVEHHLRTEHADLIESVGDCANRIARGWGRERATGRADVVDPLERCLAEREILDRLPAVLASAVRAAGYELPATPVARPPYVVVTSRGPVLRATLGPGRLVIRFDAFEVVRTSEGVRYRRLDSVETVVSFEHTS